jgi:hypothetical protein
MSSDAADPTPIAKSDTGVIVGGEQNFLVSSSHDLTSTMFLTAVVGGVGAVVLSAGIFLLYSCLKKPAEPGKVVLRRNTPREEEFPLSPAPQSPPTITRVSSHEPHRLCYLTIIAFRICP